ncbi:MAG TPA: Mur ligase family protein, partial [bacterium]|nr:Mur ligase family protein [bacterium]
AWLESLGEFHMAFGLDRVQEVLRRLGNPEACAPVIHVAGTNGKGATCAYASAILRAMGKHVGLYTSPHLSRPNERIAVDGRPIDDDSFAAAVTAVRAVADDPGQGQVELTFFEVLTCAAFVAFREAKVEVMVIEVGLGGRLDATNVVDPAVSVVTSIARDHVAVLGESIEERAGEKAAIVKPGKPAICTARDPAAAAVIGGRAREVSSPFYRLGRELLVTAGADRTGETFAIETSQPAPSLFVSGCRLSALGTHLRDDAAGAALAVKIVFPDVAPAQIVAGLAQAKWPGRGEVVHRNAPEDVDIVLDGAHNGGAAAALARALAGEGEPARDGAPRAEPRRTAVLFASMKDKEQVPVFEALASLSPVAVRTVSLGMSRSAEATALAEEGRGIFAARGCADVEAAVDRGTTDGSVQGALDETIRAVGPGGRVVVTGSLYLVGRVRERLLGAPQEIG